MQIPLKINFRHMEPSDALEAKIREKAQKLEQFSEHIMSCRVTIDLDHKHHQQGKLFSVKLDITVPGKEIVIIAIPINIMRMKMFMLPCVIPLMPQNANSKIM